MRRGGKLWIVNLQKTPYTSKATQIFAKIDDVMRMLMTKLEVQIPQFLLKRYAQFKLEAGVCENKRDLFSVRGVDDTGGPYTIFNKVTLNDDDGSSATSVDAVADDVYKAVFTFQGHYNEPDLTVEVKRSALLENNKVLDIVMTYNPNDGVWENVSSKNGETCFNFSANTGTPVILKKSEAGSSATTDADPGINLESLDLKESEQTGFAVMFKEDCPHVERSLTSVEQLVVDVKAPCEVCANVGENWLCMGCSKVYCSRYVKCHMVDHNRSSQHPVALSFSDASVWCYSCDDYIDAPVLKKLRQAVGLAKTQEA